MKLLDAIKAALFSPWGGQHGVYSGYGGWPSWPAPFAGTTYDYHQSVGTLGQNPVVRACVAWMQRAATEPPWEVVSVSAAGEENAVPKHPLVHALRRPNPFMTGRQVWEAVIEDFLLTGNAYLYKERNAAGDILHLYPMPSERVFPQWPSTGRVFISHYLHKVGGIEDRIRPSEMVHFRFGRDPANERKGWSPILAGMREVAALNEGANYRGALLRNRANPGLVISPKEKSTGQDWTKEKRDRWETLWLSKLMGDGAGKPIFAQEPIDVMKPGYSPKELDLGTMLYWDADTVCSLLGLSAMVVGISSGALNKTYSNFPEAREAATENAVIPMLWAFAETIDLQLLADFGDPETERARPDLARVRSLQEDENQKWARLDAAIKVGRISRNEGRALHGLAAVSDPSYDLPQPLLSTGFPWDQPPDWVPEPEPLPPALGAEPGEGEPESSGDASVTAEQPEAPAGQPATNGSGKALAGAGLRP